jgi:hypothetical protein
MTFVPLFSPDPSSPICDYDFLAVLGIGSFATVWLARHRLTHLKVAIKVIQRQSLQSEDSLTRFTREISLMRHMNHPFVADLFEVIEDSQSYYLVMELVENGNMLDYVNSQGRLPEDQARCYFCELISALDYLHHARFVAHRDLKAENVLLDRHNNIRLIDFGLSKEFSKGAPTLLTACGSPAYAAPEMIQGQSYTKAADMWSAGILLYAMVAGRLPFDDDNLHSLLQKVVSQEPAYPPTMSRSLVDLLRRLLCKAPHGRITIDRLKEHQWFSHCEYAVLVGFHTAGGARDAIDREVLDQMGGLGIDCRDIAHDLLLGEFSARTSVYKQLQRYRLTDRMKDLIAEMKKMRAPCVARDATEPIRAAQRPRRSVDSEDSRDDSARLLAPMGGRPTRRMSRPAILRPPAAMYGAAGGPA